MTGDVIERGDMMTPMLAACPSFMPAYEDFLADWIDEPVPLEEGQEAGLPKYIALGDLADHLIRKLEAGETQDFPAVFDVVEQWITRGSHYVSEAAVVGLLEELSNERRFETGCRDHFIPWLKPQSRKWWFEVIDFWIRLSEGRFRPLSID